MTKKQRRIRLFGIGQTKDRMGGGMPIPSMVSQMLDHLQDNGPTPVTELAAMVEKLHHKRERLEYIYHKGHKLEGDAYALFIEDVIAELEAADVAIRQEDRLALGPAFALGVRLKLPDGMGAIVYEKSARKKINDASHYDHEIKSLANDLRPDRPGIRTINKDNVERLAESMRAFGYIEHFPVWIDQHGRVLSGRHRIKAAELAGVKYLEKPVEVSSDREALEIAYIANVGAGLTQAEQTRIAKRLSAAGVDIENIGKVLGPPLKRLLIEAALLAEPGRSDRQIAKEIGVDHKTVGAVKAEMQSGGEIPHVSRTIGADDKSYPARRGNNGTSEYSQAGKISAIIKDAGPGGITSPEISNKLPDIDRGTITARLVDLEKAGHVQTVGDEKPKRYVAVADDAPSRPAPEDQYEKIVEKVLKLCSELPQPYRDRIVDKLRMEGST